MKTVLGYLLITLLFNSCSVESGPVEKADLFKQLEGRWKLVEVSGGFSGETETPEDEIIIEFSTNGRQDFHDGKALDSHAFKTGYGKSIRSTEELPMIFYADGTKQSFSLTSERLTLYDEFYDGLQFEYVKL